MVVAYFKVVSCNLPEEIKKSLRITNHQNSLTECVLTRPRSWVHLPGSTERNDVMSAKIVGIAEIEPQNFPAIRKRKVHNIAN